MELVKMLVEANLKTDYNNTYFVGAYMEKYDGKLRGRVYIGSAHFSRDEFEEAVELIREAFDGERKRRPLWKKLMRRS